MHNNIIKKNVYRITLMIIVGCVLGAITEYALIINWKWLINITQSLIFWFIVTVIVSILSRKYITAIINSILILVSMNTTYYLIRLAMSGYTNTFAMGRFTIWALLAGFFIGSAVYIIKIIFRKSYSYIHIKLKKNS